jgi:SAM-dependent methyltransferase
MNCMYRYILIPGRHHAVTRFQIEYLKKCLLQGAVDLGGTDITFDPDTEIIWGITSANHANTRRNPISGQRRLGMIEAIAKTEALPSQTYLIPNMAEKQDFAHYLIEDIYLQSRGQARLTPENCMVACSTPGVLSQYEELGFRILPVELASRDTGEVSVHRPWDVIESIVASGMEWRSNKTVRSELHPVCLEQYEHYGLGELIVETFEDPLQLSSEGDITTTRDYATYRASFEDGAHRKVAEFADEVKPGRILDIGCATGQTIKLLAEMPRLFESDFYGVEAARPLYEICEQRKAGGEFGSANTFFYQRNIMRSALFTDNSIDTAITMALTHEIESYMGREALLEFIGRIYGMLAPGGIYINYDVVGPNDKDKIVYADIRDDDGENPDELFPDLEGEAFQNFLGSLSARSRFKRFVHDFRREEDDRIEVRYETVEDQEYAVLRHADLADFLAKKDYIQSWHSEMHERFCFFEYADWTRELEKVGFELKSSSHPIQNPWLIENRFRPAADVYQMKGGKLEPVEQPVTNVLLFAMKPEA